MNIILASDHRGFSLKAALSKYLSENGYQFNDIGPNEYNQDDDYPDFVALAMNALQNSPDSLGIVTCKNGVGVSMLANKYKGIRAALCTSAEQARTAKNDDNANVLALPSEYLGTDEALEIVQTFMNTQFSGEERHKRRLDKVAEIENTNFS